MEDAEQAEVAEHAEDAEHAEAAEAAEHAVEGGQLQQADSGQLQTASGQPQAAMQSDLTDADAAKPFTPRGNPQIEPQNAGPEAHIQAVVNTGATHIRRLFEGMSDAQLINLVSSGLLGSQASSSAAGPNEGQLQAAGKEEIAGEEEQHQEHVSHQDGKVYASSAIVEPAANFGGIRVP